MRLCDLRQHRIGEHAFLAFGKRSPRFMLDPVFLHIFMCGALLMIHMGLHLIDGWDDLRKLAQVE